MPKYIARRAPSRKRTSDLPDLFSWPSATDRNPLSRAAQHLMRRYRLSADAAEVIVELAGLGRNREAR
jgi:hypothetical protein